LSLPFKEKEKGGEGRSKAWWPMECFKLSGQWNVSSLVANGMFQTWWPMECFKLGGQWNVPMLSGQWNVPMFGGQWNAPRLVANGMF
jgi:hypothetical protein